MSGDGEATVDEIDRQRPLLTARQAGLVLIAIAAIFALLYFWRYWLNAAAPQEVPPPTEVIATVTTPTQVPRALRAVGSLRAVHQVTLAPEVAGRVTAIRFEGGAHVRAGDWLVQLYDGPERADRAAAAAQAEFARLQFARSKQLFATGAESRETLQQRQSQYEQAAAAVRQLDARLVQKRIVAPFAGELGVRRINRGQYLNPGDEIATLTDLDRLYVDFTVPQQELSKLKLGGTVGVTSDAWPGQAFFARVTAIEPQISPDSRNIQIRAETSNPQHALRPGMYVEAALELPAQEAALVVPATAIQTSAQGDSVAVIRGKNPRKEGKAQFVSVTTGQRFNDAVVVSSGLKPGDVVITEGQLRVQPGARVRVTRLIPASVH